MRKEIDEKDRVLHYCDIFVKMWMGNNGGDKRDREGAYIVIVKQKTKKKCTKRVWRVVG